MKQNFSLIDKNEISILKYKINSLGDVLKKYEFDKTKLEAMFSKKYTPKKYVYTTHAHHITHTQLLIHNICTLIMLHILHTSRMFTFHTHIMLSYMVEFIHDTYCD